MPEAGVRHVDEALHILIAVARYLAANSPTKSAALHTADVTRRLMGASHYIRKSAQLRF
jgi:hypothetical protein